VLTPYIFAAVSVSFYIQKKMLLQWMVCIALMTVVYYLAVIVVSAGTAVAISMALDWRQLRCFAPSLVFGKRTQPTSPSATG
jgi:arginine:agmatine antiporter